VRWKNLIKGDGRKRYNEKDKRKPAKKFSQRSEFFCILYFGMVKFNNEIQNSCPY
jgi:hypothetical protein